MSVENSPSLDLYREGIPDKFPDPRRPRRIVWGIIVSLAVLALGFGIFTLARNGTLALLTGTGSVTGVVFDDTGNPVEADIFIFDTKLSARSDGNGVFSLSGIPAGERVVVVGYRGIAREYPAVIVSGGVIDLGELHFQPGDFDTGWAHPVEETP